MPVSDLSGKIDIKDCFPGGRVFPPLVLRGVRGNKAESLKSRAFDRLTD